MPLYVIEPRRRGKDRPHKGPPPCRPPRLRGLSLGEYHIRDGQGSEIVQAIWAAQIGRFDPLILKETKISDQEYYRNSV